MAVALSAGESQDFLSRHPISYDQLGRYGVYVRDGNRFVLVYSLANNGMGFMDVSGQASALGISNMTDGEVRQVVPTKGQAQQVGILDVISQIPDNVTYDPTLLTEGAQSAAEAVNSLATAVGTDIGTVLGGVTQGVGQGLSNISLFGIPLPFLLAGAAGLYLTFLLWQIGFFGGRRA